MRQLTGKVLLASILVLPTSALAQETITYSYDGKGRLIKVERTGGPNDGVVTEYSYQKADNRKKVKTTGVTN